MTRGDIWQSALGHAADSEARLFRTPLLCGRAVLVLWLVYLLVGPTIGFGWIDSWHNEQRAVQIVLLVLTAFAWYALLVLRPAGTRYPSGYPPLVLPFLALGLVSTALAGLPVASFAEVGLTVLLITLAIFTGLVASEDFGRSLKWAQRFSLLFATAYVLGVATRYLAAVNLERPIDLDVLVFGYANPRFPSALHALLIPFIATSVADRSGQLWLRAAAFAVLSLLWSINLGLGTRAIWFAFVLGLPFTAIVVGFRAMRRIALVIAVSAACGVALYFLLFHFAPVTAGSGSALAAPTSNTTLTSREVIWSMSWDAIKSAPWFGIGPMQFAALGSAVGAHPHNWVLQIAAEWGIPALLVCFLGVALLFRKAKRASHDGVNIVAPALAAIVALIYGMVDGNLVMPISQSTAALVFGLLLAGVGTADRAPTNRIGRALDWIGPASAILSCAVVATFAVHTLAEQPARSRSFNKSHPGAWLTPRFWEQGSIAPLDSVLRPTMNGSSYQRSHSCLP